jgi:hypothetical protein
MHERPRDRDARSNRLRMSMTRENRGPEARGLNEKAQYRSQWGLKMGWILGQEKIITVQDVDGSFGGEAGIRTPAAGSAPSSSDWGESA